MPPLSATGLRRRTAAKASCALVSTAVQSHEEIHRRVFLLVPGSRLGYGKRRRRVVWRVPFLDDCSIMQKTSD
jgi:hypothetical protein